MSDDDKNYALKSEDSQQELPAPELPFRPQFPANPPKIGLIGCGGITEQHLQAYRNAGLEVTATPPTKRAQPTVAALRSAWRSSGDILLKIARWGRGGGTSSHNAGLRPSFILCEGGGGTDRDFAPARAPRAVEVALCRN